MPKKLIEKSTQAFKAGTKIASGTFTITEKIRLPRIRGRFISRQEFVSRLQAALPGRQTVKQTGGASLSVIRGLSRVIRLREPKRQEQKVAPPKIETVPAMDIADRRIGGRTQRAIRQVLPTSIPGAQYFTLFRAQGYMDGSRLPNPLISGRTQWFSSEPFWNRTKSDGIIPLQELVDSLNDALGYQDRLGELYDFRRVCFYWSYKYQIYVKTKDGKKKVLAVRRRQGSNPTDFTTDYQRRRV